MSGSDSPAFNPGNPDSCEFDVEVNMASPDRAVTKTLKKEDVLVIVLERDSKQYPTLLMKTKDGRTACGVSYMGTPRLIACMEAGNEYTATITKLTEGGSGTAQVRNAR